MTYQRTIISLPLFLSLFFSLSLSLYIYSYVQKERDMYIHVCNMCVYIYIYMYYHHYYYYYYYYYYYIYIYIYIYIYVYQRGFLAQPPTRTKTFIQLFVSLNINNNQKAFPKHDSISKHLTFDTRTSNTGNHYPT